MSILKTKKDFELQKKWYAKLKKSGFEDIEQDEIYLNVSASTQIRARWRPHAYANKQEYYRMAGHFLYDHKFISPTEKKMWAMHADGISIRDIVLYLKSKKIVGYKSKVHATIQRLATEMCAQCKKQT